MPPAETNRRPRGSGSGGDQLRAQLYVHSFSYRYRLQHDPDFTVFSMIDDVRRHGLDGINVSVYPPEYTHLSGGDPAHLDRVAAALRDAGLGVDVETNRTDAEGLQHVMDVGTRLGARLLRTCTRMDPDGPAATLRRAITDLVHFAPRAADAGITIVIENHEDLVSREVAQLVSEVDSPAVRALFDYGNDMMVSESPVETIDDLLPWVATAHLKDQIVVRPQQDQDAFTLGVPLGAGVIPIRSLTERLLGAGLRRICLEPTWAYVAPIQPGRATAGTDESPLFDPIDVDTTDPRFCLNAESLIKIDPLRVCRDEAQMLELSYAWAATGLAGLPITLPTATRM